MRLRTRDQLQNAVLRRNNQGSPSPTTNYNSPPVTQASEDVATASTNYVRHTSRGDTPIRATTAELWQVALIAVWTEYAPTEMPEHLAVNSAGASVGASAVNTELC
jgi:hypothetical protein